MKRLRKRLDEPEKNWKFNLGDLKERASWDDYMAAYEDLIRNTATPEAPWVVVPGNKKWFARIIVAATIVAALEKLDLQFPKLDGNKRRELEEGRRAARAGDWRQGQQGQGRQEERARRPGKKAEQEGRQEG